MVEISTPDGTFSMEAPASSPFVDHVESEGLHEPKLTEWLLQELSSDSVFWDAGAGRGYHTLVASQCTATSNIHAFEPNPYFLRIFRHNMSREAVQPVIVPRFLSDTTGEDLITGTDYAARTAPPDIIKIDIEGWELTALRGMRTLLSDTMPAIGIEVHPELRADCHPGVFDILREHDYTIRQIHDFRSESGTLSSPLTDAEDIEHDGYYMLLATE